MDEQFTGKVEELCGVDVAELLAFHEKLKFEDWPQQKRLADGKIRPSMLGAGDEAIPLVNEVLGKFCGCRARDLLYSVVMPGHSIPEHRDEVPSGWVVRVHAPIRTNRRATMTVAGDDFHMAVGRAYLVNVALPHSIRNEGRTARLHLMFDVVSS